MGEQPAFLIGGALAFASILTFMVLLFSSGGSARSEQFRVIGELLSGKHGRSRRLFTLLAFFGMFVGSCTLFGGVAASDRARADRCDAFCKSRGSDRGVIGASKKPPEPAASGAKPRPPRVACHCEGGSAEPSEMPADDVPKR